MSEVWSEGYFTGVNYTYGYYRETSPVYQRFCLLLRGLTCVAADQNTAHCELGFGQGVSVNINAASNPGQYVATDFNPAHAAHAHGIACRAGTRMQLFDDSFEQLLARDNLPQFDSISLHGIWTWVSRENHRLLTRFAARYLKPGGVFYISYNCYPGWASASPLRQLFALHDRYVSGSADAARRIDGALRFSETLLAAGPLYARSTTGLDERLKRISEQNHDYLAHEYFNRDWNCMYFTEVADALAEAKLDFATTAEPMDVVDAVNLAANGIAFLKSTEHPILREQIRDYFVNRQFRKDLFQRGICRLSPAEQLEQTLATRIVLEKPARSIPMKVNGAQGEATLDPNIFQPLLLELARREYVPKSFQELLRALPTLTLAQLVTAAAVLVGSGHAAPCHSELTVEQVSKGCAALNAHLLERSRTRDDINHLASPVTGAGVLIDRFQQIFLLALSQGLTQPAEWAQFAWQLLSVQGQRLVKEGRPLETPDEALAELAMRANAFLEDRIPILRAVGIA